MSLSDRCRVTYTFILSSTLTRRSFNMITVELALGH